jgi:hypothetical protein
VRVWDITTETELLCHDTLNYDSKIEFSNDGTKIMANGELISIPSWMSLSGTTTAKSTGPVLDLDVETLEINGYWVTLSSERVLWLPPEY